MSNNGKNKGNGKKKNETAAAATDSERAELERRALALLYDKDGRKHSFINLTKESIKKMDDRELMEIVTNLERNPLLRNSSRSASNRRSFAPPNLPTPSFGSSFAPPNLPTPSFGSSSRFRPPRESRSRPPHAANSIFGPPPIPNRPRSSMRGAMNISASNITPATFFPQSAILPRPRGRNPQMHFGTFRGNFPRPPYRPPSSNRAPIPGGRKRKATKKKKRKLRKRKTKKRKLRKRKTKKRN